MVKQRIKKIIRIVVADSLMFSYQMFIIFGLLMVIGTLIKLLGYADFSSDWFWFLAGLGLVAEGGIALIKQRRLNVNSGKILA